MSFVLFDCDGVLVDSEPIIHEAEVTFLATLGLHYTDDDWNTRFVGLYYNDFMNEIRADYKKLHGSDLPEETFRQQHNIYMQLFSDKLKAFDGVVEFLQALRAANIPFCVASNSHLKPLALKLAVTGLAPYFGTHVYSSEQVARGKPAPDIYLMAMAKLGVTDPSSGFVIEDSVWGAQAGIAAGPQVIGFTAGCHDPVKQDFSLRAAGVADTAATMRAVMEKVFARMGLPIPPPAPHPDSGPEFRPA